MNNANDILFELKELGSALPGMVCNANIFQIPDLYFEELPAHIMLQIHAEKNKYNVPDGYFNGLSDQIMQKIKASEHIEDSGFAEELGEISPLLASIEKTNPFVVPAGYFESFSEVILTSGKIRTQAKVIKMRTMSASIRYLVAAAFAGLVGFSLFTMFTNNNTQPSVNSTAMAEAQTIIAKGSFDSELATLTAGDIEKYLEDSGHDPDAAVAASTINETNLPDELDYLLNENTLNDFLNKKTVAN